VRSGRRAFPAGTCAGHEKGQQHPHAR